MSGDRKTLIQILLENDDPCAGYYLSLNYSTLDDEAQHLAVRIEQITVTVDGEVIIHTIQPDDDSVVQRCFSGQHTALENPYDLGGVWFRVEHADYGEHGLWMCIAPEPQTMGLVNR